MTFSAKCIAAAIVFSLIVAAPALAVNQRVLQVAQAPEDQNEPPAEDQTPPPVQEQPDDQQRPEPKQGRPAEKEAGPPKDRTQDRDAKKTDRRSREREQAPKPEANEGAAAETPPAKSETRPAKSVVEEQDPPSPPARDGNGVANRPKEEPAAEDGSKSAVAPEPAAEQDSPAPKTSGDKKKADPVPARQPEAPQKQPAQNADREASEPANKQEATSEKGNREKRGGEGRKQRPQTNTEARPSDGAVKTLEAVKQERKKRTEDGGKRVVIEEPDKRAIVKEGGKTIIRHDETERFRRLDGKQRREKRNGLDISITVRPGGIEIYTELDDRGRPLRRYRRDRNGRNVILFDNRDYYRRNRGGSFVDAIIDLPPPRVSIPRERYIVDYQEASDVEVYEALSAPPVEDLERTYSLEEVRRSPRLRARMRRVDLDTINFEFGAWLVEDDQYPALERVAKAMNRVIDRNPNEMFMVEGHTDAVGSDEDNLSLSDRRAETVAIILTEQFGVPPENMTTQGYGEQYLKFDTQSAERGNRRVALRRITPLLSRK